MDKLNGQSMDLENKNIEELKKLFPNAVIEGKIDFEKLKLMLGEEIDDSIEKYQFTWNGKSKAIKLAQMPSTATLRPSKEDSVDWDTTENLYIEGDNLEVLKQLQKTYFGKIKMIYIDPPYNTGGDFVYKDDFKDSLKNYKEQTNQSKSSNAETSGRYHTDWLNMMYPRLMLAKNLLSQDGVIFISIDSNEEANLRKVCDEILGEDNFVTVIHVEMSTTQGMKVKAAKEGNIVKNGEFILVYSRSGKKTIGIKQLFKPNKYDVHYSQFIEEFEPGIFKEISLKDKVLKNNDIVKELRILGLLSSRGSFDLQEGYHTSPLLRAYINDNADYIVRVHDSINIPDSFSQNISDNYIRVFKSDSREYFVAKHDNGNFYQRITLASKLRVADDFFNTYGPVSIRGDWWDGFYLDMGNVKKEGKIAFDNGKKPVRLIYQILKFITSSKDFVMDFFSGSATTAHAVMKLNAEDNGNRKYIMVQLPEKLETSDSYYKEGHRTICDLGKERIRRAGQQIKQELIDKKNKAGMINENVVDPESLDIGFKVFKLDDTNIKAWDSSAEVTKESLLDQIEVTKENRSKEDVLYEILLKYGVFNHTAKEITINDKTMYDIADGYMIVNLNDKIEDTDVKEITKRSPHVVIFLESGFVNDNDKINAEATLKHNGVEDVKCI